MASKGFEGSFLAKVFYLGAGYCAFLGYRHVQDDNSDWRVLATLCAVAGACGMVGAAIDRLAARRKQSRRDEQAKWLHEEVKRVKGEIASGRAPRFFLFLRPFYITGELAIRNQDQAQSNPLLPDHWQAKTVDFETLLIQAVSHFAPVVALGMPGESVGAGRIEVDEADWKKEVELLASHARGILVIPSYRPGTIWEIDWLKARNLFSRSVFVMPPASFHYAIDVPEEWKRTAEHCEEIGVKLPPYQPEGMIFRLADDGQSETRGSMQLFPDDELRESLRSLFTISDEELLEMTAQQQSSKEAHAVEVSEHEFVRFGAELLVDGVKYYRDWAAAMSRDCYGVNADDLPRYFEAAKRVAEHPESEWERLLNDPEFGEEA